MLRVAIYLRFFLAIVILCVACNVSYAKDEEMMKLKPGQPIIVDGDKVEYFEDESKIVAEGNVTITYGDIKLSCDRIEVNTKSQQALCEGNVKIEQSEGVLTGDRIRYDFINREGEIIGGEVKAFPWFGRAQETGKVGKNEYLLRNGYVTTCDLDVPHYRVKAEEIRVFPDDKIIAKNVTFYINEVPVMWFPYYYHPLIQSRAKVQFIPGLNSDWGYFLLSAWRFYIKGNTKVDVLLDYRTKKGFAEGANLYYFGEDFGMKELGSGLLRTYFIQQNGSGTYDPTAFRDNDKSADMRQRIQWKHRIDFDSRTFGMLEFNKLSDKYVLKDYYYNEYEESGFVPENYATIISSQPNYIVDLTFKKRFNRFFTITEKVPEVKIDIPEQRLWDTTLYYGSNMSATMFKKEFAFEESPPQEVKRFDFFHKLSYVAKLGPVNLTPYGTFQETIYSRNKWEGDIISREAIGGGLNVFGRFHRIYDVNTDILGLDINGLRHIISPSANYFHLHQPTVSKDNLFQMDDIDSLEKENGVTLSLENKIQTKRHNGDNMETVDLVRFITSVDYIFRMKKDKLELKKKESYFKDLEFDLELRPYSWLYIDGKLNITPKNEAINKGSVEAALKPWKGFEMDLGYRYEKLAAEPRNQFTFDLNYDISPKWSVGWYERIDLQDGAIEEQQLSITRDLHCWEVELVYDVMGSNLIKDDFTVWLAFKVKAFPDLQLGLSRSFRKRPPGARRY